MPTEQPPFGAASLLQNSLEECRGGYANDGTGAGAWDDEPRSSPSRWGAAQAGQRPRPSLRLRLSAWERSMGSLCAAALTQHAQHAVDAAPASTLQPTQAL